MTVDDEKFKHFVECYDDFSNAYSKSVAVSKKLAEVQKNQRKKKSVQEHQRNIENCRADDLAYKFKIGILESALRSSMSDLSGSYAFTLSSPNEVKALDFMKRHGFWEGTLLYISNGLSPDEQEKIQQKAQHSFGDAGVQIVVSGKADAAVETPPEATASQNPTPTAADAEASVGNNQGHSPSFVLATTGSLEPSMAKAEDFWSKLDQRLATMENNLRSYVKDEMEALRIMNDSRLTEMKSKFQMKLTQISSEELYGWKSAVHGGSVSSGNGNSAASLLTQHPENRELYIPG